MSCGKEILCRLIVYDVYDLDSFLQGNNIHFSYRNYSTDGAKLEDRILVFIH